MTWQVSGSDVEIEGCECSAEDSALLVGVHSLDFPNSCKETAFPTLCYTPAALLAIVMCLCIVGCRILGIPVQ